MKITVLDFETADTEADSACAVGVVTIENGKILQKKHHLIRPPRKEFVFTYLHGITWNHVRNAPTFEELLPTLDDYFEGSRYIAAHNAGFDRKVLLTCYAEAGRSFSQIDTLCTVKLSRRAWNINPTTLPDVCSHFGIKLNHHDALSDADACARILTNAISEGFPIDQAKLGKPSYQIRPKSRPPASPNSLRPLKQQTETNAKLVSRPQAPKQSSGHSKKSDPPPSTQLMGYLGWVFAIIFALYVLL